MQIETDVPELAIVIATIPHLEYLFPFLDIEFRKLAEKSGVPEYIRVGTVSCDSVFINGLAEMIVEAKKHKSGVLALKGKRFCPSSSSKCLIGG